MTRAPSRPVAAVLPSSAAALVAALAAACGPTPGPVRLTDATGAEHTPLATGTAVVVVTFLSHECPIANAIAPTLRAIAMDPAHAAAAFYFVHVDPDLTAAEAAAHARQYDLPATVLLDPHHELARRLGARRTPEAIVLRHGAIVYRGAIDDQWRGLGSRAPAASRHFLRDAIEAALAGRPAPIDTTEPVGCLLPEPRAR